MNEKDKNQELVKIARNMREDISLFHKYLHEKGLMLDYAEWLIRNKNNKEHLLTLFNNDKIYCKWCGICGKYTLWDEKECLNCKNKQIEKVKKK